MLSSETDVGNVLFKEKGCNTGSAKRNDGKSLTYYYDALLVLNIDTQMRKFFF
jgi:hypothetical protein